MMTRVPSFGRWLLPASATVPAGKQCHRLGHSPPVADHLSGYEEAWDKHGSVQSSDPISHRGMVHGVALVVVVVDADRNGLPTHSPVPSDPTNTIVTEHIFYF